MGLKDLKSNLDIYGGNQVISQGGNPGGMLSNAQPPYDGGANQATGPKVGEEDYDFDFHRDSGLNDSPFEYPSGQRQTYPTNDDHLVAMLERRNVESTNTDNYGPLGSSMVTNPMTYSPIPGGNGQGTLDDVPSPNHSQNGNGLFGDALGQGKTVGGEDLHVAMLQNQYTSNINPGASYGQGQPGSTWPTLNPAPVAGGGFADLDGGLPPNGGYVNPETGTTY